LSFYSYSTSFKKDLSLLDFLNFFVIGHVAGAEQYVPQRRGSDGYDDWPPSFGQEPSERHESGGGHEERHLRIEKKGKSRNKALILPAQRPVAELGLFTGFNMKKYRDYPI
jgi:hypothetical protein